jgi:isopenicillin N synthase-like dioxygenase
VDNHQEYKGSKSLNLCKTSNMNSIPSLDLKQYVEGSKSERQQFVNELGKAYEEIGFAAVRNHYLDTELERSLYRTVKEFFDLPVETKTKYQIPGLAGQRGYTGYGKEHAKGSNKGDLKEFWHFGQYLSDQENTRFKYPKNIHVEELSEFNDVGERTYKALEKTGLEMLRAMADYLGLDTHYFDDKIEHGNSILRPIHYAPITQDPDGAVRAGAHEDINLITLLMGASAEGLEILTKDNNWVGVASLPEHLVVNVGDMLQRLTNGKFKSTTHRVVNPPREKWATPRYSIPFFLHPKSEVSLNCLPECISADNPKRYDDITAGEYLEQRLKEIGLK